MFLPSLPLLWDGACAWHVWPGGCGALGPEVVVSDAGAGTSGGCRVLLVIDSSLGSVLRCSVAAPSWVVLVGGVLGLNRCLGMLSSLPVVWA